MKITGSPLVRGGLRGAINRVLWKKQVGIWYQSGRRYCFKEPELQNNDFLCLSLFLRFDCPKIPTFHIDLVETLMRVEQEKANKCN